MKTYVHLWQFLAQFFLEWEMFQTNSVDKIEAHILCSVTFSPPELCRLWNNVKKYVTAGEAIDDNIIWLTCFARWINTATDTNTECVILTAFPRQQRLRYRASILRYTYIACLFTSQRRNYREQRALHKDGVLSEVWGFRRVDEVFALLVFLSTVYSWLPNNPQERRSHEVLKF